MREHTEQKSDTNKKDAQNDFLPNCLQDFVIFNPSGINTVQLSDVLLSLECDRLFSGVFGEGGLSGVGCPSGVLLKLEARWKEAQPTAAGELMRNRCLIFSFEILATLGTFLASSVQWG